MAGFTPEGRARRRRIVYESALTLAFLGFGLTSFVIAAVLTAGLPPWLVVAYPCAVVLAFDLLLLGLAKRWASMGAAVWCGVLGSIAVAAQAVWVREAFGGDGWPHLLAGVVLALMVALLLLVGGRSSRTFGWALLVGSVEGFAGMFWFLLVGLAAALGGT